MPEPRLTDEERELRRLSKNARSREGYQENKDARKAYHAERGKRLYTDPVYAEKMKRKSALYRAKNPEQSKKQNAIRRAKSPELCRAQSRAWFKANPDKRAEYQQNRRAKIKAAGGSLSHGLKQKLFRLQRGFCLCCGEKKLLPELHMDHVVPLALGGEHSDANIQLLCQPCNQSKHAKHPVDFMQEKGFLL